MRITLQQLTDKDACQEQVDLFRALFGDSVDVTEELCASVAGKFDFDWAASSLLAPSARAEYKRATAPAWAEYKRATAPAWAEYKRATAPARDEYERATAVAFAIAYNSQVQEHLK
jgi:hypothetical protein